MFTSFITKQYLLICSTYSWRRPIYVESGQLEYLDNWWAITNWQEATRRFEQSDHSAEQDWEDDGGHILRTAT